MKKIKEFVTFWGPSINDWTGDGPDKRFQAEEQGPVCR